MVLDVPPVLPAHKHLRDTISAHKIAVMTLIKEFCSVKMKIRNFKPFHHSDEELWFHTNKQNRDMSIMLLKLIQNPDMQLKEMINLVNPILHPKTNAAFMDRLHKLRKEGVASAMDYILSVEPLLVDPTPCAPVVHKSSVLGLFIRRMLLAFDKMNFSQVTKLCQKYNSYYDAAYGEENSIEDSSIGDIKLEEDLSEDSDSEESQILASQRQAEFFIAQQASFLQINEKAALSPKELQHKIRELLKGNRHLVEIHYLSYLNSLRVKEFCGAVKNLYHHFDKNTSLPQDSKEAPLSEDASRSFRYAALNLAILHARFGHREEAMAALQEAIRVSQEVCDNVCLQHALAWFHRLSPESSETLVERAVAKSGELNLWYLSSLGIQAWAKQKCITTAVPSSIFELIMKSDILNCQHSMTDVMAASYSQRAALWCHYGNSSMTNLISELLLYLNTSDPVRGGVYHIAEPTCLSLRNLASACALQGNYSTATTILALAKELFPPHSEHSHIWKLCDLTINFEKALYAGKWTEAEKLLSGIAIIDEQEANYRTVQLALSRGNLTRAHEIIKKLIVECENKDVSPHFHVRVLLLKASLLIITPNCCMAIPPLMACLELCKMHHLLYLEAQTILHLATAQSVLGLPNKALQLLDGIFVIVLSHGSCYDKGSCYFLYAKCQADSAEQETVESTKTAGRKAAAVLYDTAIEYFFKVKAFHKAKYALFWQTHLYNELGMNDKRNDSSLRFRTLDQQFPCSNWSSLLLP